jgi:hypothetical protein
VKKLGQRLQILFTGVQKTATLACNLCKNGGEKGPTPFVKVVEDQEIYNFPIDRLVHFCFEISSNSQSNRDS